MRTSILLGDNMKPTYAFPFHGRALAALASLLFVSVAMAQDVTGSIAGTVTDPSGAVIPRAKVTVTNTDRQAIIHTLTADSQGSYIALSLPIGHYSVTVEVPGFKKAVYQNIDLNVNERLTVNAKLETGTVQQEVTVEASAIQVELQSNTTQNLVEGQQIRELSLNARNFEQLVALMPGVTYTGTGDQLYVGVSNPLTGQSNALTFAINGGRTDQNNWTIDGADNVDRGANLTLLNYPSVDSIAEVRVQRGQYSAEFGRNASGAINVVTRSGTNKYHGSLYEFVRNNKFAANNFFSNINANRGADGKAHTAPLRYNNFGWTLGGPVQIPGIYKGHEKTFFFFSQEFRKVISYTPVQATAPTADEKKGIFTAPVCTSFSGSTCLTSSTTIATIDPVAQAYLKNIFSQIPDAPASHLLNLNFRNVFDTRQEMIKLDHTLSTNWALSGRYIQDSIPTIEPRGLFTGASLPGVSTTSTNSPGKNFSIRATANLSPSLINEAGFSFSFGAINSDPIGLVAKVNSPDINVRLPFASSLGRVPTLNFGGVSTLTGYGPYRNSNRNKSLFDNLTKIAGKHTIKTGFTISLYNKNENAAGNNVGSFTFSTTPRPTGSAASATMQGWANFLQGTVSSFTQVARDITADIHQNQGELYVQDDFRWKRNFTINIGVRYSQFRQPTDSSGFLNTFDPASFDPAKAPSIDAAGNLVAGTGDPLNGQVLAGKNSRFGNKIARENNRNFAPRIGFSWDPFKDGKTAIRVGYGLSYDSPAAGRYQDPITTNPISVQSVTYTNTTFAAITSGTASIPVSPPALTAIGHDFMTPYTQQWSFGIQRELPMKMFFDVSYVGTKGTHLWGEPDMNQLKPGQAVALGLTTADAPLTSGTTGRVNAYRPYRGYRAINLYQTWFNANYNSLQTAFKKVISGGGFVNVSYTWAKTLTNAGTNAATPQNYYDRTIEKGLSPYDRKHVMTANWSYTLPFFAKSTPILKHTLGGWQSSVIFSVSSGLPFNATSTSRGFDPAGLGIIGSGSGATLRPDQSCDVNANAPHLFTQWFNTACLVDVPTGQVRPGSAPRNLVRGPGFQKWDISLFKNIQFTESVKLQFRAESFNTLNHTNWSTISAALGAATYGQVTAARDPRIIQFGLKLYF